jgi:membrane protein DedA with SNARE-associated domain
VKSDVVVESQVGLGPVSFVTSFVAGILKAPVLWFVEGTLIASFLIVAAGVTYLLLSFENTFAREILFWLWYLSGVLSFTFIGLVREAVRF